MQALPKHWPLWLIAALTAARIALLIATPLNLHGDEAQYWAWSRHLDWGYFSKPPLIAWTIATTTGLFGNDEWAVRFAAPLAQGGAAIALYVLAKSMFGPKAAPWAAIGWALMPGVQLSSAIISTDALVLPLWSACLLCLWRFVETRSLRWAIALGVAFGLGLLAKYAMFYFLIGVTLACLFSARVRAAVLSKGGALALLIAALFLAPNLIWNAGHGFDTIKHTASNAAIGKSLFNPGSLAIFWGEQFGVAGPLQFLALGFLLVDAARRRGALAETDRFLLAFALPALAIISAQALLSRANSNWAAAAYPAAIVWIAGRFAQGKGAWLLRVSAGLHALVALLFFGALLSPRFADSVGLGNSLKRARGWEETAALVAARVQAQGNVTAIMVDNRLLFYDLSYYWRDAPPAAPLRMWVLEGAPGNSAEESAPMIAALSSNTFVVMAGQGYRDYIFADFTRASDAGEAAIPLGGRKTRTLYFATASAFAPLPRDAAFMARLNADRNASTDQ